jgi:hypothetical protein
MSLSQLLAKKEILFQLVKKKPKNLNLGRDAKVVSASLEPLKLPKKRKKKTVMMASSKLMRKSAVVKAAEVEEAAEVAAVASIREMMSPIEEVHARMTP